MNTEPPKKKRSRCFSSSFLGVKKVSGETCIFVQFSQESRYLLKKKKGNDFLRSRKNHFFQLQGQGLPFKARASGLEGRNQGRRSQADPMPSLSVKSRGSTWTDGLRWFRWCKKIQMLSERRKFFCRHVFLEGVVVMSHLLGLYATYWDCCLIEHSSHANIAGEDFFSDLHWKRT